MTGITSGGGGGYDYVETYYPSGADEGESLYHLTDDAAFVFNGSEWVEQTVTDHSQLSGVSEADHRSDSRVSDLAPVQSVNGRGGDVAGLFEASDYNPEADTHSRYTDSEAADAAPVQSVDGKTGDVATEITQKDAAKTFEESDVTVGHSATDVNGGSLGFLSETILSNPNGTANNAGTIGYVISPNEPLAGVTFTVQGGDDMGTVDNVRIEDGSGNVLTQDSDTLFPTDSVTLDADLSAGDEYWVVGDADGVGRRSYSYPRNFDLFTATDAVYKGSESSYTAAVSVTAHPESGSATISWPYPPDVYSWDAASYQVAEDGETVEVYVEEDDGSGWSQIAGPISRSDQIDADPDSRVRFRVELSRSDTSNNPTLDAIYRRWVV